MIHCWIGTEPKRELIKQLETDGRRIFCVIDFSKRIKNRVQKWKVDLLWRIDYFYYMFRVIRMEMKSLEYMMIYRS